MVFPVPRGAAYGRLMPRFATFSRRFHRPIHGTFTVSIPGRKGPASLSKGGRESTATLDWSEN